MVFSNAVRAYALACASLLVGACNPNSIGRTCINPNRDAPVGTQISSPALECPSRLCLIRANATTAANSTDCPGGRCTCTASCDSDDDCDAETLASCANGFACAVVAATGPFCCRKLCVCRDDLIPGFNVDGDGDARHVITPYACDRAAAGSIDTCNQEKP